MNFFKGIKIFAFGVVIVFIIGCAGTPIRFGGNDPNFDPTNVDFSKGRVIEGSASGFQLLLFIPISINSRHEGAYYQLCKMAGRDYITDIKIEESWTYGFVGTLYTTTLKAMAYPRMKTATEIINPSNPPSSNSEITSKSSDPTEYAKKLRELKKLKDDGLLTDQEYEQKRKAIVDGM